MIDLYEEWSLRGRASGRKEPDRLTRLPNHKKGRGRAVRPAHPLHQMVVVKASYSKVGDGTKTSAHVAYLIRDGAGEGGQNPEMFGSLDGFNVVDERDLNAQNFDVAASLSSQKTARITEFTASQNTFRDAQMSLSEGALLDASGPVSEDVQRSCEASGSPLRDAVKSTLATPEASVFDVDNAVADVFRHSGVESAKPPQASPLGNAFLDSIKDDAHVFRLILSPENGHQLDLRKYTEDFAQRLDRDLGTRLQWVAVEHHNTDQPHVHMVVRGVDQHGKDLYIRPDYFRVGIIKAAREMASNQLGLRSEREASLEAQKRVATLSPTRFDDVITKLAEPDGDRLIFRAPKASKLESVAPPKRFSTRENRRLLMQRLAFLEAQGIIKPVLLKGEKRTKTTWEVPSDVALRVRDEAQRQEREAIGQRVGRPVLASVPREKMLAQVVSRGFLDEHSGREYLVLDGAQGQSFFVATDNLTKNFDSSGRIAAGDVVELGGDAKRRSLKRVTRLSLAKEVAYDGPTWLDKLVAKETPAFKPEGFGARLNDALQARKDVLHERGVKGALLPKLRERERQNIEAKLAVATNKTLHRVTPERGFKGVLMRHVELPGGTYAVVANDTQISLIKADKFVRDIATGTHISVSQKRGENGRVRQFVDVITHTRNIQNNPER